MPITDSCWGESIAPCLLLEKCANHGYLLGAEYCCCRSKILFTITGEASIRMIVMQSGVSGHIAVDLNKYTRVQKVAPDRLVLNGDTAWHAAKQTLCVGDEPAVDVTVFSLLLGDERGVHSSRFPVVKKRPAIHQTGKADPESGPGRFRSINNKDVNVNE